MYLKLEALLAAFSDGLIDSENRFITDKYFKQYTLFFISDGEEELVEILSAAQPGLDVR